MKNKYKTIAAASMLLYLFAASGLHAQQASTTMQAQPASAPRTLSYQGVLTLTPPPFQGGGQGVVGTKATGSRLLTVTLYSGANGMNKLWQSTMNTQIDSNGVFNCTLGTADNPLPSPSAMDRPIWLGVSVDNGPELRPLSEMTASAYALNVVDNAITTAKIADSSVTNAKLADRSVTWNKMGTEYVPYIRVNGAKVNTGQNSINFTGGDGLKVDYDSNSMSVIIRPDTGGATINNTGGARPLFVGGNPTASNSDNGVFGSGNHPASTNTVGGGTSNTAFGGSAPDINGHATIGGGESNTARDTFATIGGGDTNTAAGYESTIGGGTLNLVTDADGTIAGGLRNTVRSRYSAIAGGDSNLIDTNSDASFLGGGLTNKIHDYGLGTRIGDSTYLGGDVLAGGMNNFVKSTFASLVGGVYNTIDTFADDAFIGGGMTNRITSIGISSAIVAGGANIIGTSFSFIGAGFGNNAASGVFAAQEGIVAGVGNYDSSRNSVIGGGNLNSITSPNPLSYGSSFIGAGSINSISNKGSFIGAGGLDSVNALNSAVVAGYNGKIDSTSSSSFIGAGASNTIDTGSPYSAIIGGTSNLLWGSTSNIGGGDTNTIYADSHTAYADNIGGGQGNIIRASDTSVIGGGINNAIWYSPSAFIGGGSEEFINGVTNATIAGGGGNIIGIPPAEEGDYSIIGGGRNNAIASNFDVIGGGDTNYINSFDFSTIGGGQQNRIFLTDTTSGDHSFIGGGLNNTITIGTSAIGGGEGNTIAGFVGDHSFIGGGLGNAMKAEFATIAGGAHNFVTSTFGTIGGGLQNEILAINAPFATIPGGDSLIANSFAQTVVGYNNLMSTTLVVQGTTPTFSPTNRTVEAPLLIVGNGTQSTRSDAFEVTYDGHSVVHDQLGNIPGPRSATFGGTYNDNIVYGWGDIDGGGFMRANFGVSTITHTGPGTYVIELKNSVVPNFTNMNASITVTIRHNDTTNVNNLFQFNPVDTLDGWCGRAEATDIGIFIGHPNAFLVHTYPINSCDPADIPFFFKVCAR